MPECQINHSNVRTWPNVCYLQSNNLCHGIMLKIEYTSSLEAGIYSGTLFEKNYDWLIRILFVEQYSYVDLYLDKRQLLDIMYGNILIRVLLLQSDQCCGSQSQTNASSVFIVS